MSTFCLGFLELICLFVYLFAYLGAWLVWFILDAWVICMWSLICHVFLTCVVWYHFSIILLHLCLLEVNLPLEAWLVFWFWSLVVSIFEYVLIGCLCDFLSFLCVFTPCLCFWSHSFIYTLPCLIIHTLVYISLYNFTRWLCTLMLKPCMPDPLGLYNMSLCLFWCDMAAHFGLVICFLLKLF